MSKQKAVKDNFVVTRRLVLADKPDPQQAQQFRQALEAQDGVADVSLNEKGKLELHYDASQTDLDTLLPLCQELGCRVKQGRWQRFRMNWYRFTDQNIRDNAKHEPHCCNKSPR